MPIAIKDSTIDITSEKLTKELAKEFTKYLKGGEFVFLYGEMGVGKTTFVKYFINEYQKINNLTQTEITSPTFSLLNEYQVKDIRIKHYDLFRINRKEDIKNLVVGLLHEMKSSQVNLGYDLEAIQNVVDHLRSKYKEGKDKEISKLNDELDKFQKIVEENNNLYESMLDKTTKSLEKILSNTESTSKVQ